MINQYYRVYATTKATAIETSNKKKAVVLIRAKQQLLKCITLFCTFVHRHCTKKEVIGRVLDKTRTSCINDRKKNALGSFLSSFCSFKDRPFHAHLNGTVAVLLEKRFSWEAISRVALELKMLN